MLGNREGMVADGLAVPARDPGQAEGDVLDLNVERRGIQDVEPAAGEHALPGPRWLVRTHGLIDRYGQWAHWNRKRPPHARSKRRWVQSRQGGRWLCPTSLVILRPTLRRRTTHDIRGRRRRLHARRDPAA